MDAGSAMRGFSLLLSEVGQRFDSRVALSLTMPTRCEGI